ncbi:MAG: hypothetical protein JSS56_18215 [Proteobacteria bacterium]|nr:hypothetical protein [Pseudomonadota bacterium]
MERRQEEIDTVPLDLDATPSSSKIPSDSRSFAEIVGDFFRKSGQAAAPPGRMYRAATEETAPPSAPPAQPIPSSVLYKHWNAIKADGISASQFIAFLQPLADLDGITVSYSYNGDDGKEHVYNRRHEDSPVPDSNPLSEDIRKGKLSKEKALTFALNEEGRVWIESNFMELK